MKPIYLDYNATTPIDPRVAEAMLPYLHQQFGNPSSSHLYGVTARKAVEKARQQVADLIGCKIDELIFTSGGSESNNYAIKGAVHAYREKGNHIITSAIEHPAVAEVCFYLEEHGFKVTYLPVDKYGLVDPAQVEDAITPQTILVSIMHANNEVGTIEPIAGISEIAHRHNILVHTDCAQSVGKIPVRVDQLNVDLLSIAGHKLYAPKGIGALYIKSGTQLQKLIHGANHEMNRRAGTENVLEIVGLGEACELTNKNLAASTAHMQKMRDRLERELKKLFPDIQVNGHPEKRLPNTLSVSFPGMEANTILAELKGVAASAGAACHSDRIDVSQVLTAMHVPIEYAMGTIRFSVGRFTTTDEIDRSVDEIRQVVERMKPQSPKIFLQSDLKNIRLTQFTHGLGCACKLRPQVLESVLRKLPVPTDVNVLVGTETADDAAVYRIDDKTAIIQTVDFFTPIVDDPFHFGAIAAANSLSDIYAMGGRPLFALNIVGFPSKRLPAEVLESILQGAQCKAEEAGIAIIGGHTVDDTEPKFGLAVTGIADPVSVLKNNTARPGDALILTKPLGTGILSTALKQGSLDEEQAHLLIKTMSALNKNAAEAMLEIGVNSCTDVTGFGLLGHLLEMMNGSNTSAVIESEAVQLLPGSYETATAGIVPGGTKDNYDYTLSFVEYDSSISEIRRLILNDAQTSGGLLIAIAKEKAEQLLALLHEKDVLAARIIGKVMKPETYRIEVT